MFSKVSSASTSAKMSRGKFLRLSGAGISSVCMFGIMSPGKALAQTDSTLDAEFQAAAEEYRVPKELLLAMGYVNSHWEMPPPETSAYQKGDPHGWGGYGIMALVQNPATDTLGNAAKLTGLSEDQLKTDRASNIRGGAALLAAAQGSNKPSDLAGWRKAVAGKGKGRPFQAPAGVGGGDLYTDQVDKVLKSGAAKTIHGGERVTLAAQGGLG